MSQTPTTLKLTVRVLSGCLLAALIFQLACNETSARESFAWLAPALGLVHGLTWVNRIV